MIEDWHNPIIINEDRVRAYFDWQRTVSGLSNDDTLDVELFSFAIWDLSLREEFLDGIGEILSRKYNINFVGVITYREMVKSIEYFMGHRFDNPIDAMRILGKGRMFIEYIQGISISGEFDVATLLDDAVQTCEFNLYKRGTMIRLVRVGDMEEDNGNENHENG
jgi:hypothetical protein